MPFLMCLISLKNFIDLLHCNLKMTHSVAAAPALKKSENIATLAFFVSPQGSSLTESENQKKNKNRIDPLTTTPIHRHASRFDDLQVVRERTVLVLDI